MATRIMLFSGERRGGAREGQCRGMDGAVQRERERGEGSVWPREVENTCIYGNQ